MKLLKLLNNDSSPSLDAKSGRLVKLLIAPNEPQIVAPPPPPALPCPLAFDEELVYFCLRNLPRSWMKNHLVIIGSPGSGKSTCIHPYLQSLTPRFRKGRDKPEQLVVFDAKCDAVPTLAALGFLPTEENVWLINPFDERGSVWNIADAVQSPSMAWYLAWLLVPEEKNTTAPFFTDGARLLVFAVILGLNAVLGNKWALRDLLCALGSRKRIASVTACHEEGKDIARSVLSDSKHSPGIVSSIATKVVKFSQVAALWASAKGAKKFSVQEFLKVPGVLILGNDPVLQESIQPINNLLLKAIIDEKLRQDETHEPNTYFIFDDFKSMGKLPFIEGALEKGRSKGISICLGIQSYTGLIELYTESGADNILGLCGHKTFLRAGEPRTAEWAERYFGKVRDMEASSSESWSKDGSSSSISFSLQERSLFLASVFLDIPFTGPGLPLHAISDVPSLGVTLVSSRSFDELQSWRPPPVDIKAIERRTNIKDEVLWRWTKKEEKRFCRARRKTRKGEKLKLKSLEDYRPYLPPREKPEDPNQGWLL